MIGVREARRAVGLGDNLSDAQALEALAEQVRYTQPGLAMNYDAQAAQLRRFGNVTDTWGRPPGDPNYGVPPRAVELRSERDTWGRMPGDPDYGVAPLAVEMRRQGELERLTASSGPAASSYVGDLGERLLVSLLPTATNVAQTAIFGRQPPPPTPTPEPLSTGAKVALGLAGLGVAGGLAALVGSSLASGSGRRRRRR